MQGWGRYPVAFVAIAVGASLTGCASAHRSRAGPTTSTAAARSTTTSAVAPTDPAAGDVFVDLGRLATAPDTVADTVLATFTWGGGPGQLGFIRGDQAADVGPAGFVLTGDHAALIDDQVNHRFVRVATSDGALASLPAPEACEGTMRLGPEDVLYVACFESAAFGVSAFATSGPAAGRRLAGPSGRSDNRLAVLGTPVLLTPNGAVDAGRSANPLPYVTTTGARLSDASLLPEPNARVEGASTRITYRPAGGTLRSWLVTPPGDNAAMPFFMAALPDATVVIAFSGDPAHITAARLTSTGAARVVRFRTEFATSSGYSSIGADATGLYVLASQTPSGARLVRYRLIGP